MNSVNRVCEEQQIKVTKGKGDWERGRRLPMTPEAPAFTCSQSFKRRYGDFLQRLGEVMTKAEITAAEDYSINHQ